MKDTIVKVQRAHSASQTQQVLLSSDAAAHFKQQLVKSGKGNAIRLSVKKSGCSGLSYVVEIIDTPVDSSDLILHQHDLTVYVEQSSLSFLTGCHIDLVKKGLSRAIVFNNPNAVSQCGCGESFNVVEK